MGVSQLSVLDWCKVRSKKNNPIQEALLQVLNITTKDGFQKYIISHMM